MTAPIDLEALRGHTAGPWDVSWSMAGCWLVRCSNDPRAMHHTHFKPEREADARLVAIAPTLLAEYERLTAELTTRRARDAEVEALVAAGSELISAFDGPDGYGRACKLHLAVESTRSALAPFTGVTP